MKRHVVLAGLIFLSLITASLTTVPAEALGLKVAPLQYKTTLKKDEKKQGFIDVSNPSGQTVTVVTSVQTFKQIDNDGGLQFYDDKSVTTGVTTDLSEFELGPRQALRMFFTINGGILPKGDVFAAIFFTTQPKQPINGVGQLVRVGTLLSIVNQTPGKRAAVITNLRVPFLQLTDTIDGTYTIKNTGSPNSGFYPAVSVSSQPGGKTKTVESSLVFGDRERSNDFRYQTGPGIHMVQVAYGNSKKSQLVITLNPLILLIIAMILLIVATEFILLKRRRATVRRNRPSTP